MLAPLLEVLEAAVADEEADAAASSESNSQYLCLSQILHTSSTIRLGSLRSSETRASFRQSHIASLVSSFTLAAEASA